MITLINVFLLLVPSSILFWLIRRNSLAFTKKNIFLFVKVLALVFTLPILFFGALSVATYFQLTNDSLNLKGLSEKILNHLFFRVVDGGHFYIVFIIGMSEFITAYLLAKDWVFKIGMVACLAMYLFFFPKYYMFDRVKPLKDYPNLPRYRNTFYVDRVEPAKCAGYDFQINDFKPDLSKIDQLVTVHYCFGMPY
jgi:hypothetical protein